MYREIGFVWSCAGLIGQFDDYFFFSSRRRHTSSDRDWSSDVCSSDLFANCLPRPLEPFPAQTREVDALLPVHGHRGTTRSDQIRAPLSHIERSVTVNGTR